MLSSKYAKLIAGILVTGPLAIWGLLGLPGGALANPPDENGNHNHGGGGDPTCEAADQNGDGAVDPLDSDFILARFGPCE